MDNYWNKKTFCLVTGASRGIGRSIAIEFSKKVSPKSVFLLLARSQEGLADTKKVIQQNRGHEIEVYCANIDLSIPNGDQYSSIIQDCLKATTSKPSDFQHSLIVQNAASLGIQSGLKITEMNNLSEIQDYYSFNLYSFIILNAQFFKLFPESKNQLRSAVHISSLGAVEPFKTWGLYCAAKAARDMLMKSVALESGIHTLNWAPGSVNTAIYDEAVQFTADPELAKAFINDQKAGNVLSCEQTVTKLMKAMEMQKFTKGEHVSYNDID